MKVMKPFPSQRSTLHRPFRSAFVCRAGSPAAVRVTVSPVVASPEMTTGPGVNVPPSTWLVTANSRTVDPVLNDLSTRPLTSSARVLVIVSAVSSVPIQRRTDQEPS